MSTVPNIYLSLPVELKNRQAIIQKIYDNLGTYCNTTEDSVTVDYYIPGQFYNANVVAKCDIFVFTDINMPWDININSLPSGVKRELKSAMILGKSIYYLYRNKEGELNLYHCKYQPNSLQNIQPIAGTSAHLYHFLKELKEKREGYSNKKIEEPKKVEKTAVNSVFDRRLLL